MHVPSPESKAEGFRVRLRRVAQEPLRTKHARIRIRRHVVENRPVRMLYIYTVMYTRHNSPHVSDNMRSFRDEVPVEINVFRGDVRDRFWGGL